MKELTFDRKMIRFITWAMLFSTVIILVVSAISTVMSITNKSTQIAKNEVEAMAVNTEDNFNQYNNLIWSVILDRHVQDYLSEEEDIYKYNNDATSVLDNVCNMWGNINFISILRQDEKGHLIKGNAIPNWIVNYREAMKKDQENAIPMGNSAMQMSFTKQFSMKGEYTLSIYYPLFSNLRIGKRLGTLCINVNDANLTQLIANTGSSKNFIVDTAFVHQDGNIISSTKEEELNTKLTGTQFKDEGQTSITGKGLIINQKLSGWDFYYVTRIEWWELLKDSLWTVVLLLAVLCLIIIFSVRIAKTMVTKAYEPWGNVVVAMGEVSSGNLDTRLEVLETDPDMRVVSQGFNAMMNQLIQLMDQIKEEQYQMDQIQMEALQSQIQPHFLYNTLDCIHWQAVISGNKDISELVKALANYYRICLSKGKDIITIGEEIEYTRNYLYIQKMRYDEILDYEIIEDKNVEKAIIPKLTLQPLVENGIYHGIKMMNGKRGKIIIKVGGNDQEVYIDVFDDGRGMTEQEIIEINEAVNTFDQEFGYGVRNVNRRIQLYYGKEYGLTYYKNMDRGVRVRVLLPNWYDRKGKRKFYDESTDS
ncbi:two-component system sensor histidine kinase YesM [Aequitasia blattaphilus]|uniref:Histidine kinase n=1 Tax=Aequitasia blattaphilus TaxID=2949332 RepID=A0ABT1E928_9FIRM|nr:histidine kinase [Aequitasia blattaphilus]MCP1102129.1 histidine kinase [Aequitasia blattaphilus]MCR8614769.1 histidine kinase [Aequitasia blattaphilus]